MGPNDLKTYLKAKAELVNQALAGYLPEAQPKIVIAMRYSLMAGGKRIRPVLCISTAEALGVDGRITLPAALALEMIHTYSLIHDDLPALDNDQLRRGQPTCHSRFDEPTAILAGDALLTLAFQVLAEAGSDGDAEVWLQVIASIAAAAGFKGMVEGQMRDLSAEGARLDLAALQAMHTLKTGKLLQAAVTCGALIAGAREDQLAAIKAYGHHIGLAFQVADDLLNVTGDPQIMGKAVGTDADREKNTYPALLGLVESRRYANRLVAKALQAIDAFDTKADPLRAIAQYIVDRNR
ncbi:MAG: polyprenyl synthetase family protein [Desulfosarcinaceae bacterium]|nr:polyprenyl synthetase family protein [Desulfosarcinaceae bacterium]